MQGITLTVTLSVIIPIIFSLSGITVLTGCTKPNSEDIGGSIETQIPLQNHAGEYSLQRVQLTQLQSLRSMRGDYAEFFLSPKVQSGGLDGSAFQGRYAKMGDLWIARDMMSLTAATIYYHLQELWHLDSSVGAADLKPKRQQVALSAIIEDGDGRVQNNALFEVSSRALLFVTYTDTDLPISVNSGILAHEHFHSLFYPLVLEPLIQGNFVSDAHSGLYQLAGHAPSRSSGSVTTASNSPVPTATSPATDASQKRRNLIYHLLWLKAINEGLADVWGWAYTWDPDFISLSLPSQKTLRTLKVQQEISSFVKASSMKPLAAVIDQADLEDIPSLITNAGYVVGTEWARFFKQYLDTNLQNPDVSSPEGRSIARQKMLRGIIVSLGKMKNDMLALKSTAADSELPGNIYDPVNLLQSFSETQENQSEASCQLLADYMHSLPKTLSKPDEKSESSVLQKDNLRKYSCKEVSGHGFQPNEVPKESYEK
ncbi:MAG: hypothetical protein IPK04_03005 [Bdellovibrionales bacterium]|nr:hypothetical protein [Bdellovibrionales bacterium]